MSDENNRPLNNNDDGMQQPEHHHHHHRHHRRHRGWKIFWSVVGVLVLVALFFAGMAWHNLKSTTDDMYSSAGATKSRDAQKVLDLTHKTVGNLVKRELTLSRLSFSINTDRLQS